MTFDPLECPHCSTLVLPTGDGVCPSCRYNINEELTPEQAENLTAARARIAEPRRMLASRRNPPAVSTVNTLLPRHLAAIFDNLIAMVLGVLAAKSVAEDLPALQLLALVAAYLAYYLLLEGLTSRTPGKLITGLAVTQFNGARCTWRQSLIRTGFRILEVNPILLGFMPAAVSIVFSRYHQRIGDKVAETIVVPSGRVRKMR
ncbi:MAG: RDD family protein [Pirellulaceae bacterium]